MLIPLLFFGSGATALVYEVMWSKYLSLLFGSTIQAQTVVLAVFMGGLALGNRLFGSRARFWRDPLPVYGYIEIAIGLYAFFFAFAYQAADFIFQSAGRPLLSHRGWLLALKAVLSLALLLGPTILMGGTLPLLASWLERRVSDSSRWAARFYAINSLGAVLGAVLAGFFLVPWLGLSSTLQATALTNCLIGATAVALGRKQTPPASEPVLQPPLPSASAAPLLWSRAGLVALTGGVSMGLEVLASRSLSLIFGASLQSFATVLIAFILGIGIGSFLVASPRWKRLATSASVVAFLLLAALWIGLIIFQMESSVDLYRIARTGLARTPMGYRYHQLVSACFSIVVLGIPAAFLGSVLPLCIRTQSREGEGLAQEVGRLLTANTLGCVAGVLITGFVLMPHLGLRSSFTVLAMVLCLAAGLIALESRVRWGIAAAPAVSLAILGVSLLQAESWKHVLSSGVFRARETEIDRSAMPLRRKHIRILFYEDAADATVSIEQGDGVGAPDQVSLRINGKVDATSRGDLSTQYLLAHLPMLAKPQSRDIFVLGLGSGITAGALLGHPVRQVSIAENCEPVVRAARFFDPWNRGVVTNRLIKIWREDARTVLKLSPELYDIIISEPSNPWMAGVGSVFSREFYELAASRLRPQGVMAQWFHIYEMHDGIIDLVLQTFSSVFPFLEVWDPGTGDIIMLGSRQPWESNPRTYAEVFQREEPRRDLERIGLKNPDWVWARQLASQRGGFAIPDKGAMQSDEYPVLEYEAPRAFYLGQTSTLLFLFDERTWQRGLAAPAKAALLGALDSTQVKTVFGEFSSVNTDLMKTLSALVQAKGAAPLESSGARGPMPLLFLPALHGAAIDALPQSDAAKEFLGAQREIESNAPEAAAALDRLEQRLGERPARGTPSQSNLAALAARVSLRERDYSRAGRILAAALQSDPGSQELRFLARILQREARPPSTPLAKTPEAGLAR